MFCTRGTQFTWHQWMLVMSVFMDITHTSFIVEIGWIALYRCRFCSKRQSFWCQILLTMINEIGDVNMRQRWYRWRKTWTATNRNNNSINWRDWCESKKWINKYGTENFWGGSGLLSTKLLHSKLAVPVLCASYARPMNEWLFVNLCNTNSANTVQHGFSVDLCIETVQVLTG